MIQLPHHFTPREYQLPFFKAMDSGFKRAVLLWSRRTGKDKTCFNYMVKESFRRVGTYYYFFPTYNQGRKALWDAIDKDGFKVLGHIPKELIVGKPNQTDMKVNLKNGSVIQVVGSDNIDSIVGTNPVGCVFSEYPLQDPRGWDFVSPILRENGGWAVFDFTPRGRNHGFRLFEMAKNNPDWFCQKLTVDDTHGHGGTMGPAEIDAERRSGMDEDLIQQEYYCSFDAAVPGAYYGEQMRLAQKDGRITKVPYDPMLPVNTYWDLGIGDSTAIWFEQTLRNEIRMIDYYQNSGVGLDHYVKTLREKPYNYGSHFAPHDAEARELGTGKSVTEIARELGLDFQIVPRLSVDDGINAARLVFSRVWFDENKCRKGLDCLSFYHKDYDDKAETFRLKPVHDWSSHGADAFRYFAVAHEDQLDWRPKDRYKQKKNRFLSWMSA